PRNRERRVPRPFQAPRNRARRVPQPPRAPRSRARRRLGPRDSRAPYSIQACGEQPRPDLRPRILRAVAPEEPGGAFPWYPQARLAPRLGEERAEPPR